MTTNFCLSSDQFISFKDFLNAFVLLRGDQMDVLLQEHQKTGLPLRELVVKLGFLEDSDVMQALKQYANFQVALQREVQESLIESVPLEAMVKLKMLPYRCKDDKRQLKIACLDPFDIQSLDQLKGFFNEVPNFQLLTISQQDFYACLEEVRAKDNDKEKSGFAHFNEEECRPWGRDLRHPSVIEKELNYFSAEKMIQGFLDQAIGFKASDLHFNAHAAHVTVRLRQLGALRELTTFHKNQWAQTLSYLKVQSGMNINEHRLPQTGRMTYAYAGREVDLRCSCHPTCEGENFVIRILDRLASIFDLDHLGFKADQINLLRCEIKRPHGLIVVTGPTGSGKTTTLYALLQELAKHSLNIMTLEDPVEYDLQGIQQTQVDSKIGLDFAQGIRSILRQDPDVILVGEIRDEETARMALRASMTGHLVLTTLHTNSALSVPQRFQDLGVPAALLSGNLNCLISQRLKTVAAKNYGESSSRKAIAEMIAVDDDLDALIANGASFGELRAYARAQKIFLLKDEIDSFIREGAL